MTVIGLTGPNASGKGTVVAYLNTMGFDTFSLSDIIREELRRQGVTPDRTRMTQTGEALRRTFGEGVLAERILPKLTARCVVHSIRHPGEVKVLRATGDFFLLGIDASQTIRELRLRQRGRPGDAHQSEAFQREEAAQNNADQGGQKIHACLAMADAVIVNDGTVDALHQHVDAVMSAYLGTADES